MPQTRAQTKAQAEDANGEMVGTKPGQQAAGGTRPLSSKGKQPSKRVKTEKPSKSGPQHAATPQEASASKIDQLTVTTQKSPDTPHFDPSQNFTLSIQISTASINFDGSTKMELQYHY
jgi:hypothetical protein